MLYEVITNVGITIVTYTVIDSSGNWDTCSFKVTINDQVPPTIIDCPNDTIVYADADECSTYVELDGPIRITSYNVCYTKLLRLRMPGS